MTVERLISALWAEADLKERAIAEDAQEMAAKIISAMQEASARLDAQIESRKKRLDMGEAARSSAREAIRKRKAELYAVAGAMESVQAATGVLYRQFMESPAYPAYLSRQVEAIKKGSGPILRIQADPVTAAAMRKGGIPNVQEDATLANGFVAAVGDGKTRVFCLFDTQLKKLWKDVAPGLVVKITEALAGGD